MKDKNHMLFLIDTGKDFGKIQHHFMIKSQNKLERSYLNIIKAIYDKPTANLIVNRENLKAFLLTSGTRQWLSLSLILFN
jgi:hypothetical protein